MISYLCTHQWLICHIQIFPLFSRQKNHLIQINTHIKHAEKKIFQIGCKIFPLSALAPLRTFIFVFGRRLSGRFSLLLVYYESKCSLRTWEVYRSDHYLGGLQWVAWAFPVVPFYSIEAIRVLALLVIHSIQIGWATGVKPPT